MDAEQTSAAAVSALDELIAITDRDSALISETPDATAYAKGHDLPDGRLAATTVQHYLRQIGWIADAERIVAETMTAIRARDDYILAVGFRKCSPEKIADLRAFYGPFPALHAVTGSEESELLEIKTKRVIAKLRRHAERLRNALAGLAGGADRTAPALSDQKYRILQAMQILKAVGAEKRATSNEIALKADGPRANVNGFRVPLAELKRDGYLYSKEGRGGGFWLTDRGLTVANKL